MGYTFKLSDQLNQELVALIWKMLHVEDKVHKVSLITFLGVLHQAKELTLSH